MDTGFIAMTIIWLFSLVGWGFSIKKVELLREDIAVLVHVLNDCGIAITKGLSEEPKHYNIEDTNHE